MQWSTKEIQLFAKGNQCESLVITKHPQPADLLEGYLALYIVSRVPFELIQ